MESKSLSTPLLRVNGLCDSHCFRNQCIRGPQQCCLSNLTGSLSPSIRHVSLVVVMWRLSWKRNHLAARLFFQSDRKEDLQDSKNNVTMQKVFEIVIYQRCTICLENNSNGIFAQMDWVGLTSDQECAEPTKVLPTDHYLVKAIQTKLW